VDLASRSCSVLVPGTRIRFAAAPDERKRNPDEPLVVSAATGMDGPVEGLERDGESTRYNAPGPNSRHGGGSSRNAPSRSARRGHGLEAVGGASASRFAGRVTGWAGKGFGFLSLDAFDPASLPEPTSAEDRAAHQRLLAQLATGTSPSVYCHVKAVTRASGAAEAPEQAGLLVGTAVSVVVARNLRDGGAALQAVDVRAPDGTSGLELADMEAHRRAGGGRGPRPRGPGDRGRTPRGRSSGAPGGGGTGRAPAAATAAPAAAGAAPAGDATAPRQRVRVWRTPGAAQPTNGASEQPRAARGRGAGAAGASGAKAAKPAASSEEGWTVA